MQCELLRNREQKENKKTCNAGSGDIVQNATNNCCETIYDSANNATTVCFACPFFVCWRQLVEDVLRGAISKEMKLCEIQFHLRVISSTLRVLYESMFLVEFPGACIFGVHA